MKKITITASFTEAKEMFNNITSIDPNNENDTATLIIYNTVANSQMTDVVFLENLTGLDLGTKEKLYDYYSKALVIDLEFMDKVIRAQLIDELQ